MSEVGTVPLFPLGLVLFPEMDLPLHIFEERYKRMIRECLEQETEFGVVLLEGGGFRPVGCTARVVRVMRNYEDGRMDILTCGCRRFRVRQVMEDKPYLEAKVDFFDDEPEDTSPDMEACARQGLDLLHRLAEISGDPPEGSTRDDPDLKRISFLLAGNPSFHPAEKQRFVEMTSTGSRLRKGVEAMRKTLERLLLTQEIERIIHGNGRVPESLRTRSTF